MDMEAYLAVAGDYRLGELVTEQPHPRTVGLAGYARDNLPEAIEAMHAVDLQALDNLDKRLDPLPELTLAVKRTLDRGGRIYLAGCGATGRLSLAIETLAREAWLDQPSTDTVTGFMAGGDAALVRSLESFEDFPEYGDRQLTELGFTRHDLLIAITEGGETPFVIGACLKAAELATEPPWFLYCNPPDVVSRVADRSRRVLTHSHVRAFCLECGPMALSGSTRLQASTVQMLVAGAAISEALGAESASELVQAFREAIASHHPGFLAPFIEAEANIYNAGNHVLYQTDHYGITVLTDTTERSPTFSTAPFENTASPGDETSWCYLSLPGCPDSATAWKTLLGREPRTLDWDVLEGRASRDRLIGFDISSRAAEWRSDRNPGRSQYPFLVHSPEVRLEFAGLSHSLKQDGQPVLIKHLLLKCLLNIHSTLVMGRLERFESNLMTSVRPSNYKLVDRAARYRQNKYHQETGGELSYREAVRLVFADLG